MVITIEFIVTMATIILSTTVRIEDCYCIAYIIYTSIFWMHKRWWVCVTHRPDWW